jgi:hypothetical protein
MTEQKTMNAFEATIALARGKTVQLANGYIYELNKQDQLLGRDCLGETFPYNSLPIGVYTIYQEPPKMKTWYKGFFELTAGVITESRDWYSDLEKAKVSSNGKFIYHEECQFPEVEEC